MVPGGRSAALAAAATLVLAGCGGGADPDPSAFGSAADRACRGLSAAVTELQDGLVRTAASSERAALASALTRYATAVRRTADGLAAAAPPHADRAFRDAAVTGLRRHATTMRSAAAQARRGRVSAGLADELHGAELPAVPAAVLADAPGCRRPAR